MSHSNLTRWIENAEARNFYQLATERKPQLVETQYLHLGEKIGRIGSHALSYLSRPLCPVRASSGND